MPVKPFTSFIAALNPNLIELPNNELPKASAALRPIIAEEVAAPADTPSTLTAALLKPSKSLELNELVSAPATAPLAAPVNGSLPCKIAPTAPAIERPVALAIAGPNVSLMLDVTAFSASVEDNP